MPHKILRRKQVEELTGLSRSTIYALMAEDDFPKPIQLGPRSVGWLESDLNEWINGRISLCR
ncbi:helix-turn-helix transcriptional regulator [Neptuniibacter sp. QD48_55]|uniref:helix-turn-helix transcriptional regulator n=1 Tax=Neptuniibacter sp. QD48_55 TaxID=3398212 RepID=UPI0039F5567E